MNLKNISEDYSKALKANDFEAIGEIISILNNAPPSFKITALLLYERIEQDLFERSRNITNLDSKAFSQSIKDWQERSQTTNIKEEKKTPVEVIESFETSFIEFYNRNRKLFSDFKDYYLFKFETTEKPCPTSIIIITCEISSNHPILAELKRNESVLAIQKFTVKQFNDHKKNLLADPQHSYICILSIAPNLNGVDNIIEDIQLIFSSFQKVSTISIDNRDSDIKIFKESIVSEEFSVVEDNSNKVFNNKSISYDVERLIKSFFQKNIAILDYRILNPGASGSSVIEVQAIYIRLVASKRYVFKVAKKINGKSGKLKIEMENFNTWVKPVPTPQTTYAAEYKDNETVEAIQYIYASPDSVRDALSFAEILKIFFNTENNIDLNLIIDRLLQCELFTGWYNTETVKKSCEQLYKPFLRNEGRIFQAIEEVSDPEIDISTLKQFYEQIKSYYLESNEKTCHGDLHSDNFFWDGERVTLIDFGFTGTHHAIVDHTFFETAIKLRHFPKYIPIKEIIEYELRFLDPQSFEPNFDLSFIKREKLKAFYKIINNVRVDSKKYLISQGFINQYLISLFIITFRQIQYLDLNSLLALKISELLSKNIILK